jgi:hypothetical protein
MKVKVKLSGQECGLSIFCLTLMTTVLGMFFFFAMAGEYFKFVSSAILLLFKIPVCRSGQSWS